MASVYPKTPDKKTTVKAVADDCIVSKEEAKSGCWAMRDIWAQPALEDLTGIQAYNAKDSLYYAKQFMERIFSAAEALEDFTEPGRKVPEAEATETIRKLTFQSYRNMYLNQNNLVFILAVIHGSPDLASIEQKPWVLG
ncbi:MAG: type II toxin-antitoxin system RelE/ParE family toxin [Methylococcales bacterium]|nr:type II toxin-antitoxin system RelE/ParE family toxin [Methylococcales bacterium]